MPPEFDAKTGCAASISACRYQFNRRRWINLPYRNVQSTSLALIMTHAHEPLNFHITRDNPPLSNLKFKEF